MSIPSLMATYFTHLCNNATVTGERSKEVSTLTFQSLLRVHLLDSPSNSLHVKSSKRPPLDARHIIQAIHLSMGFYPCTTMKKNRYTFALHQEHKFPWKRY